jgi:hypothetical protein
MKKVIAKLEEVEGTSASVWTCSKCKRETLAGWDDEIEQPAYCSNCGAKFDGWDRKNESSLNQRN